MAQMAEISPCLLVVDDEPMTIQLIQIAFEMEGFTVLTAGSGEEALEKVYDCDVVLLDLMMPEMDGMEVLRRIRANPELEGLPVIMFTAKSDGLTAALARKAGVSGFHTKPPDLTHLVIDASRLAARRISDLALLKAEGERPTEEA